jgi:hypothetical protein
MTILLLYIIFSYHFTEITISKNENYYVTIITCQPEKIAKWLEPDKNLPIVNLLLFFIK